MTMNRSVIFAIGALVLALAAAACSSSPAAEPGAADPTAAPTAMETPTQVTLVATPEPTPDTGTDPVSETALTLTSQDVLAIVGDSVALTVEQLQPQAIDSSEAPVPVDAIDEWVITLFQAPETGAAIVFSVMDLATVKDAETVFAEVQIGFTGQTVSVGLGDDSVAFEPNASGIGSIITFIQGDLVVSMTATLPPNGEPLTDLAGLTSLGRTASDRLGGESSAGAQAVLDEVLALWAATSASEYTFEFNWVCFCIREAHRQKRDDSWEAIVHEQKMEDVRSDVDLARAERDRKLALIQSELNVRLGKEKLEVQKRQQEWELEFQEKSSTSQMDRLQRVQEMNAQFVERQQKMQVDMDNLKADSASNRELNRIQAMSNLSTEALVATAGAENAALLADLKKHESTQDAAKTQAAANPSAELNEERLRMYEKMNEAEKSKADAIAEAYKTAMQSQQGNVQQMIGGLAQASTPAPQVPVGFPPPMPPATAVPPMPGAETWHVSLNGQQSPGLQLAQVQQYIQSGQLTRESMVWKTGMPAWAPAGQAPELAHLFNAPGPPPMPGTPPADGAPPMPQ